jgi:hypothetical protein
LGQLKYADKGPFPDTTVYKLPFGVLNVGIGVDPAGKVWIQPYGSTLVDSVAADTGGYVATRPIYVLNPNGTHAAFSPIHILTGPDQNNVTVTDTIMGRLGYGGTTDPSDGNFVGVWGTRTPQPGMLMWEVDYQTGAGVRRILNPAGLTTNSPASVAVDENGEVYVSMVLGALPGQIFGTDFQPGTQFATAVDAIGRTTGVSRSGNDIYTPRFTILKTYVYHSDNGSLGPYAITDSLFLGGSIETIAIHPTTGHVWVATDRRSSRDSTNLMYTWTPNAFYAWDPVGKALVDSFTVSAWDPGATGPLPRGAAFSPTGDTLYVAHFDVATEPVIRRFTLSPVSVRREEGVVPGGFELKQNFPNPFNPSTEIRFSVPASGNTTLIVYDMLGREVRGLVNGHLAAGSYSVTFNAGDLASGTYVYVLKAGSVHMTKKMVLMK